MRDAAAFRPVLREQIAARVVAAHHSTADHPGPVGDERHVARARYAADHRAA